MVGTRDVGAGVYRGLYLGAVARVITVFASLDP